jgi:hypothetical protein
MIEKTAVCRQKFNNESITTTIFAERVSAGLRHPGWDFSGHGPGAGAGDQETAAAIWQRLMQGGRRYLSICVRFRAGVDIDGGEQKSER